MLDGSKIVVGSELTDDKVELFTLLIYGKDEPDDNDVWELIVFDIDT